MYLERKLFPPFHTRSLIGAILENGSLVLRSPFSFCQWRMGLVKISLLQIQPCFFTLSASYCGRGKLADGQWLRDCTHSLCVSAVPGVKLGRSLKILQLTQVCKSQGPKAENNMECTAWQSTAALSDLSSWSNMESRGLFPLVEFEERAHLFLMHFFYLKRTHKVPFY